MKTKFSNSELTHVWAQQSQDSGSGSNMFFEKTKIFSYGYHFCIANFIKPNVVLFNSKNPSNSTAKQKRHVSRSIHSVRIFEVPRVDFTINNEAENHSINIDYFKNQILEKSNKALTSNKYSEEYIFDAIKFSMMALDYCNEFNLSKSLKNWFAKPIEITENLQTRIDAQKEKAIQAAIAKEAREIIENAERKKLFAEKIGQWLQGDNVSLPYFNSVFLRQKNEQIETSLGAKVSVKTAKVLFTLIKSGKDVKGFDVDGYTVISLNGVLKIGCHVIERDEINRFADLMKWGQIAVH